MAKQMNFTDEYGESYPESYWRPVQRNFSDEDKNAYIVFYGFPNKAASKREGRRRIIGQHSYSLSQQELEEFFEADISKVPNGNIKKVSDHVKTQAYAFATQKKDVDTGQKDEKGQPVLKSFFEGAEDV